MLCKCLICISLWEICCVQPKIIFTFIFYSSQIVGKTCWLLYLSEVKIFKAQGWGCQEMNYIVRGPPKWAQVGLKMANIKGFWGDLQITMVMASGFTGPPKSFQTQLSLIHPRLHKQNLLTHPRCHTKMVRHMLRATKQSFLLSFLIQARLWARTVGYLLWLSSKYSKHKVEDARKWTTSLGDPQSELKCGLKWPTSRAPGNTCK